MNTPNFPIAPDKGQVFSYIFDPIQNSWKASIGQTFATTEGSITRPTGNATAYTAKDSISNSTGTGASVLIFSGAAQHTGGSSLVRSALLYSDASGTTGRLRLHLFNIAPSGIGDNLPVTELWANRTKKIGVLDFPALTTEGAASTASHSYISGAQFPITCAANDSKIYGIVETLDNFTPTSGQSFYTKLFLEYN